MLSSLLSRTKQKILGILFLSPNQEFYLRELQRKTGISQGTLHRELKQLVTDGILKSEKRGRQLFYSVNNANPVYRELKQIVIKTFGIKDILQVELKPFKKKIKSAFIYGSVASGEDTAKSDIDLMIIGKVTFAELSGALEKAEKSLGRSINFTVYPEKEFMTKVKEKNHFLSTVLKSEQNFIVGVKDDLRKLAGK